MERWGGMLGIALCGWLGASFDAAACSCVAPKGSEEEQVQAEFAEATHVFVGKVLSAADRGRWRAHGISNPDGR